MGLDLEKQFISKDLYEAKYQLLITKQEIAGLQHLNDSEAFIEYSNNIYENIGRILNY